MKILCLQLARLGDIYQTWPVLRALRRQNPNAEIELMVRSRFAEAAEGLDVIDRVIQLPTQLWLTSDISTAPGQIGEWLNHENLSGYDRIINFSFSPASSYLTDIIGAPDVSGYTRYSDGYLAIPDEPSSYFYAQVGSDRSNRIHLTDVFAMVARVELTQDDFRPPSWIIEQPQSGVVVHIGASRQKKNLCREQWLQLICEIAERTSETVTVVGTKDEMNEELASAIESIKNAKYLVGQTSLRDLFQTVANAKLFIGCDSVGLHIATLTDTPTLNVSFECVRFWETGPRAKGSRVLWYESNNSCDIDRVAQEAICMLNGTYSRLPVILKAERFGVIYDLVGYEEDELSWQFIRALYGDSEWPDCSEKIIQLGFTRLKELASLALQQIGLLEKQGPQSVAGAILNQIDLLIEEVGHLAVDLSPVIRWFQAEKSRIPPADFQQILTATKSLFLKLNEICHIVRINSEIERSSEMEALWKS